MRKHYILHISQHLVHTFCLTFAQRVISSYPQLENVYNTSEEMIYLSLMPHYLRQVDCERPLLSAGLDSRACEGKGGTAPFA
jgi:hypothetical protein